MSGSKFFDVPLGRAAYERPETRVKSYSQGLKVLGQDDAETQAGRCIGCGVPGCNSGCPVGQKIPLFLKAVEDGDWRTAHEVASQSYLYGILPKVCPTEENLCEFNCTVAKVEHFATPPTLIQGHPLKNTVAISAVEAAIWENAIDKGWLQYPKPLKETNLSVAVVGAGPAGLYAALDLRALGHKVTVYDPATEIGGLLLNGIPNFKFEKSHLRIVHEAMTDTGLKLALESGINSPHQPTLRRLLHANDGVVIATGTYAARDITHPDTREPLKGHENAIKAMDFLIAHNNLVENQTPVPEHLKADGKRVVIIGAGDTSMDCFGTSLRGTLKAAAKEITIMQRSAVASGAYKEKAARKAEADVLMGKSDELFLHAVPLQIKKVGDHFEIEIRDAHGHKRTIEADMIINATGFEKEDLSRKFNMDITADHRGATNIPGLVVAGDALMGATLAVRAAQSGRQAAHLTRQHLRHLRT